MASSSLDAMVDATPVDRDRVVDFLRADGNPVKVVKREVKATLAKITRRPAEGATAA